MARFRFGRPISLRWNGLLIEGPAETVFEIPDEYYEEFNEDIGPVEPTLVWLDSDEGATLRGRVTALEGATVVSLSNSTPLALGTAAPGTGASSSRNDHVHPTTGLSLSGHNHSGVYDPAGTAASAVATHVAAADPHSIYLTDAEGDAQYSQLDHTHTSLSNNLQINKADSKLQLLNTTSGSGTEDGMYLLMADTDVGYLWNAETNGALVFGTGGAERARITPAGKFGIGTNAPAHQLEIVGPASVTVGVSAGGAGFAELELVGQAGKNYITSDDTLSFDIGGAERATVATTGLNVTSGTLSQGGTAVSLSGHSHSYASTTHASTHAAAGSDPLSGISPSQITGTAVVTADSRLSDSRTPTAHASTHNAGGSDALAIDAVAATGSLRTLGTTATSAAAGNHGHSGTYVTPGGTVTLTGNVTGSATMSSTGAVSISTTIASIPSNTVTLGTDTTGNYVSGLTAGTGVTISGTAGEGWSPTVAIGQAVGTTSNVTFNNVTGNGTTSLNGSTTIGNATSDQVKFTNLLQTSTITNSYSAIRLYNASASVPWRAFVDSSSERFKSNIVYEDASDSILDLRSVSYHDKLEFEEKGEEAPRQRGFLAEEVAANPDGETFVVFNAEGQADAIQYERLVVPLHSALRHLRKRVEELEAKVNESAS